MSSFDFQTKAKASFEAKESHDLSHLCDYPEFPSSETFESYLYTYGWHVKYDVLRYNLFETFRCWNLKPCPNRVFTRRFCYYDYEQYLHSHFRLVSSSYHEAPDDMKGFDFKTFCDIRVPNCTCTIPE